jgi:hypothetical protein
VNVEFGDKRLGRVCKALHAAMVEQQQVCLRSLGGCRAREMRFGRFLRNERVAVELLIEGACAGVGPRAQGRHVLLIQDTSELNFQSHGARVSGLGKVGNGVDAGLFIHPVLTVDAEDGACLGLAHVHLWQRTQAKAANYRQLPIEDKESVRWIEAAQQARERLPEAALMTVVADRESDIYEMWSRLPDKRTHLLIRACRDRALDLAAVDSDTKTKTKTRTLFDWLSAQPVQGEYLLQTEARPGNRSAHQARMHVRFGQVCIRRPRHCSDKNAPDNLKLWAIEVAEDPSTVVDKEDPIHWRLLTTHPLSDLQDALQCVDWYRQRWHIEQTFRTLKRQGLDIESSLVEEGERLEKLAVLALSAAVQTMQLTMAREGHSQRPASDCFDERGQVFLAQVNPTLEGKTEKQKNPHAPRSLAWAGWIVARLGGWKGYASERKPGPITMLNGLQALSRIRQGWELATRV